MNPNFRLPVLDRTNSFFPPNQNNNPNICPSFPVLSQNSALPFPPHQNSQHVFPSNTHSHGNLPSFLPDLQTIKYVPPPPLMTSAPLAISNNRLPEAPTPPWNQAPIIDKRQFNDQVNPFQPSSTNYRPPMHPSTNYSDRNLPYSGSSNVFHHQQNLSKDTPGPQTSNAFQGNVATFSNINSCINAQTRPNSFVLNGMGYNHNGTSAFPNIRNSTIHQMNNNPRSFSGTRPMQMNTNQGSWTPGFGGFSNGNQNANEQARQKSYARDSNTRILHDASKNNFLHRNENRRFNQQGSNRKFNFNDSVPQASNSHRYQNRKMNNGQGRHNIKAEKNWEAKPFSCDTCDRAFASEVELRDHLSEHITCNYGGCQFEAHPKIVALHKKMQHDTGYADVISKLKNADDIEKWRAERRRRFPTAENIRKRKAEEAEKEARGEIIENKDFGKFKKPNKHQNDQNNEQGNFRKRRRHQRNRNAPTRIEYSHSVARVDVNISESETDSDDDSHIKVPKFLGMSTVHSPEEENNEIIIQELSSNFKEGKEQQHVEEAQSTTRPPVLSGMPTHTSIPTRSCAPVLTNSGPGSPASSCASNRKQSQSYNSDIQDSNLVGSTTTMNTEFGSSCPISTSNNAQDDASQKITSNSIIDVGSYNESPIELAPTSTNVSFDITDHLISDSPINKDSHNESVVLLVEKNASSMSKSIETVDISEDQISETVIDLDSDDDLPLELPVEKNASSISKNSEIVEVPPSVIFNSTVNASSDDESPIELPIKKSSFSNNQGFERDNNIPQKKDASTPYQNIEKGEKGDYKKDQHDSKAKMFRERTLEPRKSSLLEKLLADDIRHERNVMMQCIRHVVKNNFFGIM